MARSGLAGSTKEERRKNKGPSSCARAFSPHFMKRIIFAVLLALAWSSPGEASLEMDGVWKAGVWETTVWASGVWREAGVPAGGTHHKRRGKLGFGLL